MRRALSVIAVGLALGFSPAAQAQIFWTDWTSAVPGAPGSATGTLSYGSGSTSVSYAGEVLANTQTDGSGTNYWTEGSPPAYGGLGPSPNTDIITLQGESASPTTHTITFGTALLNPYMAIVSLGTPASPVTYDFDTPFTIVSTGTGYWNVVTGCAGTIVAGCILTQGADDSILVGQEGHGLIRFAGTVSSLSWTASPQEYWHGFTVGVVPEPGTYALLLAGLGALVLVARRRKPA